MEPLKFDVNKMRVASPCPIRWESMSGDEMVRHCHSCQLNIYNISTLTTAEAENLIATHEGRLCIRLHRRTDGTVITRDCPTGLRALRKRVARVASAAFATVLGFVSFGIAQDSRVTPRSSIVKIITKPTSDTTTVIHGRVRDPNGALIPGARVSLFGIKKKALKKVLTNDEGLFELRIDRPEVGYKIRIELNGFKTVDIILNNVEKNDNEIDAVLEVDSTTVVVGIYGTDNGIDLTSSTVKTTITREMIDRMPK